MANRAFRRDICTLDNELVILDGTIMLSGSTQGFNTGSTVAAGRGMVTCTISGTVGKVLSSSAGVVATGEVITLRDPVTRLGSGSYQINLQNNYPRIQSAIFQIAPSGSADYDWSVVPNTLTTKFGTEANIASISGSNGYQPGAVVGFLLMSGTSGLRAPADPTRPMYIHVQLALKNSKV